MYDPMFAKSFNRHERKRLGCGALVLCFLAALSVCSTFKRNMHPPSISNSPAAFGYDNVDLQLSINAVEDVLIANDIGDNDSTPTVGGGRNSRISNNTAQNMLVLNDEDASSQPTAIAIETKKVEPLCRILQSHADYCEIEGDVRLDPNSSTLFVVRPRSSILEPTRSWIIKPYPRRGISRVKNWTVTLIADDDDRLPHCAKSHTLPAVLFSIGGFTGNHFHDFADLIFPLFSTSFRFKREVHFILSDYKPWWSSKFRGLLGRLTRHELVDIDREKQVQCYNKIIAGLQFYKELIVDPSLRPSSCVSMHEFRQFLRQVYSLERTRATKWTKGQNRTRPRLMIVSRKRTRVLSNEVEVSRAARKLGYEVILAEAGVSTNLTAFARTVNSCDVLMGVHGAGLTNMLFLPDNAVLIQVVPLGGIDAFARLDFGNPAAGMSIRYLEYKINTKESSLGELYPTDHPVLKDPLSLHKKGWGEMKSVYLDNQNVTIDIHRFKGTLAKALKLLRR